MQPTTRSTAVSLPALARLAPLVGTAVALGGCNGAFIGNFVVLGLTLGVFFGTLGLGRARASTQGQPQGPSSTPSAERSHSDV